MVLSNFLTKKSGSVLVTERSLVTSTHMLTKISDAALHCASNVVTDTRSHSLFCSFSALNVISLVIYLISDIYPLHHCHGRRWENLICRDTMAVSKEMKLRNPPLSSSDLYLGLWQAWKGWYRFLTYCPINWQKSHGIHRIEQWLRTVGPVNPWICR